MLDKYVNDTLRDKDKGYLFKTGKEAMGKSPEIMSAYDKYVDDVVSKSGVWGAQEQQLRSIAAKKRIGLEQYAETHDKEQSDVWQESVYTDALSNVFSKAINGRSNPAELEKYKRDGYTILDNYAVTKGWYNDPEMYKIKRKEFEGNFNAQILDAYLADGSLRAREFFHKNKDSFSPEKQNAYLKQIHSEEVNYGARSAAQILVMKTPEEAYKEIDAIENIDLRNATENEYNRLLRHQETIQKQNDIKTSNEIVWI
jgi:hypothetical protein